METFEAMRVEIVIEAPLLRRLTDSLERAGVKGYTVLPVLGGSGQSGPWTREGQVGSAGGMSMVVAIVAAERADSLVEAAYKVVARHIGVVSVTPCRTVRRDRF
jgi:nitrogen regulatory protein PII